MTTTFKGKRVTRRDVIVALKKFDRAYPDSNSYDGWMEKDAYKYAILEQEKYYPPKHILSEITGIDTTEFRGGDQTNRVFRQLDFIVTDKPATK